MHNLSRLIRAWALTMTLALGGVVIMGDAAQAQTAKARATFERGYPAGDGDGFAAGRNDYTDRVNQDFRDYDRYKRADRGYRTSYGALADYQNGYRLGFEMGYIDGYYGRTYSARLPQHALTLRAGTTDASASTSASVYVPDGTVMELRLTTQISTNTSREGDRFIATVPSPKEYEAATVTGHIAKLNRSGRMPGRTEMALEFDSIKLRDGRTGVLHAQLEKIHESESVKSVDEEGNVESSSKGQDTAVRTGGGAAIGAFIGAGVGAGSVYIQGNKDLILEPGTEMTVRTSAPQGARR
jgi:hypothetical protein